MYSTALFLLNRWINVNQLFKNHHEEITKITKIKKKQMLKKKKKREKKPTFRNSIVQLQNTQDKKTVLKADRKSLLSKERLLDLQLTFQKEQWKPENNNIFICSNKIIINLECIFSKAIFQKQE